MTKPLRLPLGVGLIGCGNVSDSYFTHAKRFPGLIKILACAGRDVDRAKAKAAEQGLGRGCSVSELLADPAIDVVLNLTNPTAHTAINLQALRAGKHCYCEKPFAVSYRDGLRVLAEAAKRKLRVGVAPDTVLGPGMQTCRKLIDDGAIGKPISATANFLNHGSEGWHPNPDFFYQPGGGPLLGGSPYHFSALVTLLGPARSVSAMAKTTFKERLITSQPFSGQRIKVRTPTHLAGVVEFAQGTVATVTMSFDVWAHHLPALEIHGTEGSLQCSDPFQFAGDVQLWTRETKQWQKVPLLHTDEAGRSLGLAEMALAIHERRPHRASGEMALHVTEIMEAFFRSADKGRKVPLKSTCRRPAPLPSGLK
ncbi:MAG: Gfo/Idh/MocA family oxidoreductase [Planctomycetia bacterium]|nr:Gfo/Idh/MocA family oxidoreductase [Planctomycetia bacterium]